MAWYNASWPYRQKVTINATLVDEAFSLLPIPASAFNDHLFDNAKSDASDLRFTTADETTELPIYVANHSQSGRTGRYFVNVSTVSNPSSDVDIWVYYGNSGASGYATNATYGRDAVFADYEGFYLPGMSTTDLTGGGKNLTANNTPGTEASNWEGITAATYNGSNQYHNYDGTQAVTDWPMSLEVAAKTSVGTVYQNLLGLGDASSVSSYAYIRLDYNTTFSKGEASFRGATGSESRPLSATNISLNVWARYISTRDADTGTSYIYTNGGGAGSNSTTLGAMGATDLDQLRIGVGVGTSLSSYLTGSIAYACTSNVVRSSNYVSTMHAAWSNSAFLTMGAIETENGGLSGWQIFQTAAQTTTSDVDWSNPNNALSENSDAASCTLDDSSLLYSEILSLTNGVGITSVPTDADTYTVKFRVKRRGQETSAREIVDKLVKMIDDTSTQVGDNLADTFTKWPSGGGDKDYTVTGYTPDGSEFTSAFGLAIQADGSNTNGSTLAEILTVWWMVEWEYSSSVTGTGSITTGAVDVDANGTMDLDGTGSITIGATDVDGVGTAELNATGSITTGAVDVDGSATMSLTGTGSIVIGGVDVDGMGGNLGEGDIDTGAVDVDGVGTFRINGTGSITIGAVDVDSNGTTPTIFTTDWLLFTTANSSAPGDIAWTSPNNALSLNADYANSGIELDEVTEALRLTAPSGLSLPSSAVPIAIDFRISSSVGNDTGSSLTSAFMRVIQGGVASGDQFEINTMPNTQGMDTFTNLGLHGLSWANGMTDFGSNFGLQIVCENDTLDAGVRDARIHSVEFRVNYTISSVEGEGSITTGNIEVSGQGTYGINGSGSIVTGGVTVTSAGNTDFCVCCVGYTLMNLLEIRRRVAKESGHHELVTNYAGGDYSDNGMDEYIRGAARYLDDKFQYNKSEAWFYKKLAAGECEVTFLNNRIIKEVWINTSGGDRTKLKRLTLNEMRDMYTKDTIAGEATGTPLYWVPSVLGLAPQQLEDDASTFALAGLTDYDLVMFGDHYPHKGIYVMPPADTDTTVMVLAEWYSAELCDDEDVSFWSQYPEILAMATRREMEIHLHRNTTGYRDFEAPILDRLNDLYKNLIAEEVSGPPEDLVMNG